MTGKDTFSRLSGNFSPCSSFPNGIDTQAENPGASSAQGFLPVVTYVGTSGPFPVTLFVPCWSLLSLIFSRPRFF